MKKLYILILVLSAIPIFSSCSSMRDCNGVKHQRLANGVRI